ncbi:hypothetical protein R6Q59_011678 [Mikania micrantha]
MSKSGKNTNRWWASDKFSVSLILYTVCSQDMVFYGGLSECPVCGGALECVGQNYSCSGSYSEWSTCTYSTRDPPRRIEPIKLPDFVQESAVSDLLMKHQDPK